MTPTWALLSLRQPQETRGLFSESGGGRGQTPGEEPSLPTPEGSDAGQGLR